MEPLDHCLCFPWAGRGVADATPGSAPGFSRRKHPPRPAMTGPSSLVSPEHGDEKWPVGAFVVTGQLLGGGTNRWCGWRLGGTDRPLPGEWLMSKLGSWRHKTKSWACPPPIRKDSMFCPLSSKHTDVVFHPFLPSVLATCGQSKYFHLNWSCASRASRDQQPGIYPGYVVPRCMCMCSRETSRLQVAARGSRSGAGTLTP